MTFTWCFGWKRFWAMLSSNSLMAFRSRWCRDGLQNSRYTEPSTCIVGSETGQHTHDCSYEFAWFPYSESIAKKKANFPIGRIPLNRYNSPFHRHLVKKSPNLGVTTTISSLHTTNMTFWHYSARHQQIPLCGTDTSWSLHCILCAFSIVNSQTNLWEINVVIAKIGCSRTNCNQTRYLYLWPK